MEKIELGNRFIIFENGETYPNRFFIRECFMKDSDVEKEYVLVMSNVFHLSAYTNNFDLRKVTFEFDHNHPLYIPLLKLLHDKDELIIDDDNTIYEEAKYMRVYKDGNIFIEFRDKLIDNDTKYDFDRFTIFINNIYPAKSIIDRKDSRTKFYLQDFFKESCDVLENIDNKKLIKK